MYGFDMLRDVELGKITKIVNEIIIGNDKNLLKLKKSVKNLFHNITQSDLDNLPKANLISVTKTLEILKKNKLSEIDRALLDYNFNKDNAKKYRWFYFSGKFSDEQFKSFVKEIYEYLMQEKEMETKKEFMSFIGWTLTVGGYWDDFKKENKKKDFLIDFYLTNYEKPEINILLIGNIRHKDIIKKIETILKR